MGLCPDEILLLTRCVIDEAINEDFVRGCFWLFRFVVRDERIR